MKKIFKLIVSVVVLFSSLASFGVNRLNAQEAIEITVWHSLGGVNSGAFEQMVSDFNASVGMEKGITVTPVYQGDDVMTTLSTLSQANDVENFPDVGLIYGLAISRIKDFEQTVSVESMYATDENITVAKEDLRENFVRAFSYQDELIGMPLNNSTILLYYNKDMFEEVGLDPNSPPTTIDEIAQAIDALKIVDGNNVDRYGLNVEVRRYQLANWIGGQGEYNFFGNNEGGRDGRMTEVTFGEDGSLDKFLTEWQKVIETGGYKPVEDNINEEFASQLFGMAIMSSSRIATINQLTEGAFEYGVGFLPKVSAEDTGGAAVGGGSLVMFDKGDQAKVDASWEFLQYAASPEVQAKFSIATGYLPVNKKTLELPEILSHFEEYPQYAIANEQVEQSHPNVQEPFEIITWEIDDIIRENLQSFAYGDMTKEEVIEAIVTQSNERLESYNLAN